MVARSDLSLTRILYIKAALGVAYRFTQIKPTHRPACNPLIVSLALPDTAGPEKFSATEQTLFTHQSANQVQWLNYFTYGCLPTLILLVNFLIAFSTGWMVQKHSTYGHYRNERVQKD